MLPELDRHIASHMDRASLACAARVSKLWYDIFSPVLWRHVSLKHLCEDDNYDDEFNFIPWIPSASSPPSLPSSCSSTWSSWSSSSSSPPKSPTSLSQGSSSSTGITALHNSKLSLVQRAFVHASRNKMLKGLVRHGHHIIELTATGITDQEMAVIRQCCTNLRVLELIGGRYSAENLTDLFTMCRDSIQTVRFRSCVLLKDIFQPLAHLSNLRDFELHGSFVGNTITSPYFFQQDLFPMLRACPLLRSVLIEQVYIIDQHVGQTFDVASSQTASGEGEGGGGGGGGDSPLTGSELVSSGSTSMLSVHLKAARSQPYVAVPSPSSSLRKFSLDCGDIPASVIMAFLATCPQLQELVLDWSRELCDFSLSQLYTKCPRLTKVSLSRCELITEVGLKILFKSYPNLVTVDLSHNELSDSVLEELARSCRWVQHLSLNHCRNVTDVGIQQLLLNLGSLTYLGLRFIPGLSCLMLDGFLTAGFAPVLASSLLAYTPSELSTYVPRQWACRDTLESLLLPDLVQPSRAMLEQYHHNLVMSEGLGSVEAVGVRESDAIVQKGLSLFTNLRTMVLGGNNMEMRVALSGLPSAHTLESLRITKLKRAMTIEDAEWLIETGFPKLQQLNIPQFGNPQVPEWIRMQQPGLLSTDK
ncbi:hypothetical protein BG006_005768 [Podila minutissima]|uniref:F-box domain-containing protein n=1 Tax=Podila minutissima TaxID=64525 RepID=A0A9P5SM68_9FUNG|nr:hypothetical protein BG006_005768 [Podila minutissima]